jgi:soluble lytic murein transglycosylase
LFAVIALPSAAALAAPQAATGGLTQSKAGLSKPQSVAFAVPRSEPLGGEEVALPQPLTPSDTVLYQQIFADQRAGQVAQAARLVPRLDSRLLMGQVLAQLYLGMYHHSTADELEGWLEKYKDEPESGQIYHLLLERDPAAAQRVGKPRVHYLPEPELVFSGAASPQPFSPSLPGAIGAQVSALVHGGQTGSAIRLIAQDNAISAAQGATLRGEVARGLFTSGRYAQAFAIGSGAVRESHGGAWRPAYIAGLAAWQLDNIDGALPYFIEAAATPGASPAQHAAAAFWAARASLRLKRPEAYLRWLGRAAHSRDSFYGMLAGRLLGQGPGGSGFGSALSEADVESVDAVADGRLAFALLEVGRPAEAARALRAVWPQIQANPPLGRAVMGVAARAGLIDVAVALKQVLPAPGGALAGISLPMPALHPLGGFSVDPSLVYALARTESGFDAHAVSPVGARGLMQLMPQTASSMARRRGISADAANPSINLALGQTYLRYLGRQTGVSRNLLDILASYNAGPVAADSWVAKMNNHGDPLLFMESIPDGATRRFVRQVLTDSWIYAEELGRTPESLDAMAEGKYPQLRPYQVKVLASR